MLILTRKVGESFKIGDDIEIVVTEIKKGAVRIGVNAPKEMSIYRKEIYDRIQEENKIAVITDIESTELNKLSDLFKLHIKG